MLYECKSPEDLLKTIKDNKIEMIDLRFTDVPGLWQHFSVPPRALDHDNIVDGVGFDGSSIRGFQEIQESDMLVIPDPATAFLDPFTEAPTLVLWPKPRPQATPQGRIFSCAPCRCAAGHAHQHGVHPRTARHSC